MNGGHRTHREEAAHTAGGVCGADPGRAAEDGAARVLALWSPDWPVTAAAMAARVPAHRPAAVVVANRVLACSAVARAQGVRRGLRRREAQARCPDLAVLDRDPDRDARAFEPVVAAVEELAPGVEVVRPGLVALNAQGPVGWFGGEQEAAEALVDRVAARTGVECQVGVADGLFAAVLAARRALAVAPGDTPAFLAPLGVEELDREPDVDRSELVGLLRRLGLRSLGAFAALDAEDVASRFGADAVHCHRLARGLDPRPPVRRAPPEELSVEIELDPPVDRVDAAAFAARGLAERLHRTLAGHGLSCTRLGVAARTVGGEDLHRIWRCAEPLTPAGTVDRVRWQLDAWLTRRRRSGEDEADEAGAGAVAHLRLVPEETVTAGALQLGLWGEVGEADERAGRALVRVQALLGPEAVVTAVLVGGRDPAEQVRFVPWGDDRDLGLPAAAPLAEGHGAGGRPQGADAGAGPGPVPVEAGGGAVGGGVLRVRAEGRAGASDDGGIGGCAGSGRPPAGPVGPQVDGAVPGAGRAGAGPRPDVGLVAAGSAGRAGSTEGTVGPVAEPGAGPAGAGPGAGPARGASGSAGRAVSGAEAGPGAWGGSGGDGEFAVAPAGWPEDVVRRTGRVSAADLPDAVRMRPTNRRRRVPAPRPPAGRAPVPDPPPSWPGRLPAPSPATVPPQPLPAALTAADGSPVQLPAPDLLSAPPQHLAVDGAAPRRVLGWAGPWPVQQRWWTPGSAASSRLQVAVDDGEALLLLAREGRWWVIGQYD